MYAWVHVLYPDPPKKPEMLQRLYACMHGCMCPAPGRMNAALRLHDSEDKLLQPFLPYLRLLLNGLNKIPLVQAQVYRGVDGRLEKVEVDGWVDGWMDG